MSKGSNEFTVLKRPPQSQISIQGAHLGCGGTGNSDYGCAADKSTATVYFLILALQFCSCRVDLENFTQLGI